MLLWSLSIVLLVACSDSVLSAAVDIRGTRIVQTSPTSLLVTWLLPHGPDGNPSPVEVPCVTHRSDAEDTKWRQAFGVKHTYPGLTSGDLYTAQLTGLDTDRKVQYRVGDCGWDKWGDSRSVKLKHPDEPAHVLVFGDQGVSDTARDIADAITMDIMDEAVDQVWHLGDVPYNLPDPLKRNWDITEDWYVALKQASWDAWGEIMEGATSRVPYFALPGNHEFEPLDLPSSYKHRLPMPGTDLGALARHANGEANALDSVKMYYSFNMGGAHVVMLNSEEDFRPGSPQYGWLVQDLSATRKAGGDSKRIILCAHRPMYSSARKGGSDLHLRAVLEPLLFEYKVAIVFTGHDHSYERTHPVSSPNGGMGPSGDENWAGTVHIRIGTGGINHLSSWLTPDRPDWSAVRALAYGYGRLHLPPSGDITFEYVKVQPDERSPDDGSRGIIDSLTIPAARPRGPANTDEPTGAPTGGLPAVAPALMGSIPVPPSLRGQKVAQPTDGDDTALMSGLQVDPSTADRPQALVDEQQQQQRQQQDGVEVDDQRQQLSASRDRSPVLLTDSTMSLLTTLGLVAVLLVAGFKLMLPVFAKRACPRVRREKPNDEKL